MIRLTYRVAMFHVLLGIAVAHAQDSGNPSRVAVVDWLEGYEKAWEQKDPDAAAALFAVDARYYETPYAEPLRGQSGIRDYWAMVTADQSDIDFTFELVGITNGTVVAGWSAMFTLLSNGAMVELNGVFLLSFDAANRCTTLREWWHAR